MFNLFLPFVDDKDFIMLTLFQDYLKNNPEKLQYKESVIFAEYGTFPRAIWNGGRSLQNYLPKMKPHHIEERIQYLNNQNIHLHLTFTNNLLTPELLSDEYCNMILEILNQYKENCIIVASPLLQKYIRKNYPNLKLAASITCGNSIELFKKEINEDFDYVVGYPKKGILEYVSTLSRYDKERVEILLSSGCANCPWVVKHATFDSVNNLSQDFEKFFKCYYSDPNFKHLPDQWEPDFVLSAQDCLDAGINKFKYAGRGENVHINLSVNIEKLIKPEFQKEAFETIWKKYLDSEQLF